MNKGIIRNEYNKKIRLINDYNKKYYNENLSVVPDSDYDVLKRNNTFRKKI